jgi:hypothetical protein
VELSSKYDPQMGYIDHTTSTQVRPKPIHSHPNHTI